MSRYRHIVLFWLKVKNPEALAAARAQLLGLRNRIPGLLSLEAEVDQEHSARSCDLCLDTVFESKAALDAYRTHPAHLPVVAYMKEHCADSRAADYPIPD